MSDRDDSTHERLDELRAARVLDDLSDDERRELEQLEGELSAPEDESLELAAALVALAEEELPAAAPSAQLKRRLADDAAAYFASGASTPVEPPARPSESMPRRAEAPSLWRRSGVAKHACCRRPVPSVRMRR